MVNAPARTWFITGASSGLGHALAEAVLTRGERAIVTARDVARVAHFAAANPNAAYPITLDVTGDDDAIRGAVAEAEREFGGIDVLVNNAGFGLVGAIEEVSDAEARGVFDANVFGLLRVTRAVLPSMRARRAGHVVNIGSVGGLVGIAGSGHYCASKFAVDGLSEALHAELAPLGIHVTVVEPGGFRTDFAGRSLHEAAATIAAYAETAGKWRHDIRASVDGHQPGDPKLAALAIIAVVDAAKPPLRLVLGSGALDRVRRKLADVGAELDLWEAVGRSTEFATAAE